MGGDSDQREKKVNGEPNWGHKKDWQGGKWKWG